MGLLDKTNPNATVKSILRRACFTSSGCFLLCLLGMFLRDDWSSGRWKVAVTAAALGFLVGALCEWQISEQDVAAPLVSEEQADEGQSRTKPSMSNPRTAAACADFCQRFFRNYFEDDSSDLPGYEPSEMTFEEWASETKYTPLCEQDGPGLYTFRMENTAGDVWRFTFRFDNGRWTIHTATSGDSRNEACVDWLDEVYSQWFVPLLDRITYKSL